MLSTIVALNLAFRRNHDRSECVGAFFRVVNVVWPIFASLLPSLGGLLLLLDIFMERSVGETEFDIELVPGAEVAL